jgi:hypothetical protein
MSLTRFSVSTGLVYLLTLNFLFSSPAAAQEKVIHRFVGAPSDGYFPVGSLSADSEGNLYGATYSGGTFGDGTVFELIRPAAANGGWRESILYNFTGGADGANPFGGLVFDTHGNLFGTTYYSPANSGVGGVVYELSPPAAGGGPWTETTLYDFSQSITAVGINPQGTLAIDAAGNLYGVTAAGGAGMADDCGDLGCGTAFELQPPSAAGGRWTLIDVHDFLVTLTDGIGPNGILLGPGGVLYGTACCGGTGGGGIAFRLTPPASGGSWTENVLYAFSGNGLNGDGTRPNGLTLDTKGGFYGTTQHGGSSGIGNGTVFHLTPSHTGTAWTESILYDFTGGSDGAVPEGGLLVDSAGALYGTTERGGSAPCTANGGLGCGTVFKLTPPAESGGAWTLTTIYDFQGGLDGVGPQGNLFLEKGVLYGATAFGGSSANTGSGTIFRVVP